MRDPQGAFVEIDTAAAQFGQFLGAERGESAEQDHQAPARTHGVGEVEDLLHGGGRPLVGFLPTSALDPARVGPQEVVVDRSLQDGLQQPVRLGDRRGTRCLEPLGSPGADGGRCDLVQVLAAEGRQEVQA